MRELALNVLDVAENSLAAGAKLVYIRLDIRPSEDMFTITIEDDGCGMDRNMLEKVCDPFTTSRTTRSVGLGVPFFKFAAESAGGTFQISSEQGKGTRVAASFRISHIDRMPLGDFGGVILQLVTMNETVNFYIEVTARNISGTLDTRIMREILGEISFNEPEVRAYLKEYIQENLVSVYGGRL